MQKNGKKAKFSSWYTLTAALAAAAFSAIGGIWLQGVPLVGLPRAKDVKSVTITCGKRQAELTASDDVRLMVGAASLLNYRLFGAVEDAPALAVTYHLKNGGTRNIEASAASVWWRGMAHVLHEPGVFVNIVSTLYPGGPNAG